MPVSIRLQNSDMTHTVRVIRYWSNHIKNDLSVPELFDVCIERCQTTSVECIVNCDNDLMCISECIVEVTACRLIEKSMFNWLSELVL